VILFPLHRYSGRRGHVGEAGLDVAADLNGTFELACRPAVLLHLLGEVPDLFRGLQMDEGLEVGPAAFCKRVQT